MLILKHPRSRLELLREPEDWRQFLADPDKHWKDGRSAKMLAEAWQSGSADVDVPVEIARAMRGTPFAAFEPILAIPEYEVALPGGRRPSQNDLFVLGRIEGDLAVLMVEGKVDESFGPHLDEWLVDASPGKRQRLGALRHALTASPVLEAVRLGAPYAAMIVHSFSARDAGLDDYRRFAGVLGIRGQAEGLERAETIASPELWVGWVRGGAGVEGEEDRAPARRQPTRTGELPAIVAHADWGSDPKKRWVCVAELTGGSSYAVSAPELVGDANTLLRRLHERSGGGRVLAGFDFPIGVPATYAERAGIESFPEVLGELGSNEWSSFYEVARDASEISLTRPFYPMNSGRKKGERRQSHLLTALGVESMDDLLRVCDRGNENRNAASPIFWTLGAKQVGKAAILGWQEILAPAIRDPTLDVALWPFDGRLSELVATRDITIAETYPAEACLHLGMTPPGRGWSKTKREGRLAQRDLLLGWSAQRPVDIRPELGELIDDGFGASKSAEDPFDAMLGLLSMLEVVLGYRAEGPGGVPNREVEGWILGQLA